MTTVRTSHITQPCSLTFYSLKYVIRSMGLSAAICSRKKTLYLKTPNVCMSDRITQKVLVRYYIFTRTSFLDVVQELCCSKQVRTSLKSCCGNRIYLSVKNSVKDQIKIFCNWRFCVICEHQRVGEICCLHLNGREEGGENPVWIICYMKAA